MITRVVAGVVGILALFVAVPEVSGAATCVLSKALQTGYCVNLPALPDPTSAE